MKATELVGKKAIRTAPTCRGDRSYMMGKGVVIGYASDSVIVIEDDFFKNGWSTGSDFCDDNWAPWPDCSARKADNAKECPHFKPAIVIRTRKQLSQGGDLGYRVIEIKALDREHLPLDYLDGYPHCYFNVPHQTLYVFSGPSSSFGIAPGETYSKGQLLKRIEEVKQCGARLHEINQRTRAEREAWSGEEVFRI